MAPNWNKVPKTVHQLRYNNYLQITKSETNVRKRKLTNIWFFREISQVFNDKTEEGRKRWDDLKSRVVEHNIRIMAKYYTQVSLKRMAELLDLKETETEEFLSKMVVDKAVEAKVDRLDNIVNFTKHQDPNEVHLKKSMLKTHEMKY